MREPRSLAAAVAAVFSIVLALPGPLLATEGGSRADDAVPAHRAEAGARLHRRAELASLRIARHLDEARGARNERQARCLDGALSQANSALRAIGERLGRRLVDARDAARSARILRALAGRVDEVEALAAACVGTTAFAAGRDGRTRVEVIVDRSVPREDPDELARR